MSEKRENTGRIVEDGVEVYLPNPSFTKQTIKKKKQQP